MGLQLLPEAVETPASPELSSRETTNLCVKYISTYKKFCIKEFVKKFTICLSVYNDEELYQCAFYVPENRNR